MLRVLPYRQIAEEIAVRLAAQRQGLDALAPWPEEVVVPSRGVADSITAALLERFPGGFAGLRIHSLENLARRIVNAAGETPRVATAEERRLAMRTVARSLGQPLAESRGVAAMLERSYRDVRDSAMALAELAGKAAAARGLRNVRRTEAVVRAWQEYERLLAKLNAVDPADLLLRAARLAGPSTPPQLVAGFYDMTGAQRALVRALQQADRVAAVWIPTSEEFAQPLIAELQSAARRAQSAEEDPAREAGGGLLPSALCALRSGASALRSARYDTRVDEIAGVCGSIAALLDAGVAPPAIAVTARSLEAYDVRLLNRLAAQHGFSTMLDEEVPLRAHRIGRGAATLLRLRERDFPRADVLELVRDGLRCRTSLRVDAVDAATRRARVAGGTTAALRNLAGRSGPVADYLALVAELEEMTADPQELLGRLPELFRIETDHDLEAAAALDDVAALFRRAAIWNRPLDLPSVLDAIEQKMVRRVSGPGTGAPLPRVWAGDVMRLRGRAFAHTFVLKMEDDVFPQRRLEDPLLPDSDRRLLGIREIGDGAAEERLLLSLLLDATTETVHFTHAGGDGFGKVLRASRFVRGVESEGVRDHTPPHPASGHLLPRDRGGEGTRDGEPGISIASPLSPLQRGEGGRRPGEGLLPHPNLPRQLQLLVQRGRGGVFDGILGPLEGALAAKVESLSPTQLEEFGECPQKFMLKHLLGAQDLDQPERELQIHHREKGTIDHRILERFYRQLPADEIEAAIAALPRLPEATASRLEQLIDEQFDALEAESPAFNGTVRGIERRATRRLLREFVIRDLADLGASGLRPKYFEYRFGSKHRQPADHPQPFLVDGGEATVRVEGTIDRIDADATRLRVVDYKSGKANRHKDLAAKIDRGIRLQLALYALAATKIFGVDGASVSGVIRPLAGENRKLEFELADKREALLDTLRLFVRSIRRGRFPAFPDDGDDIGSCKYCPANHACRTLHDAEERNAVRRHGDARTLLAGEES